MFEQILQALKEEQEAIREQGKFTAYLTNGNREYSDLSYHFYSFITDTELKVPAEFIAELVDSKKRYKNCILSSIAKDNVIIGIPSSENPPVSISGITLELDRSFIVSAIKGSLENRVYLSKLHNPKLEVLFRDPDKQQVIPYDKSSVLRFLQNSSFTLNQYQEKAIFHALSNEVSFVWGPPGTGKTYTLATIAAANLALNQSTLILAPSNNAVDVAINTLAKAVINSSIKLRYENGEILRYGFFHKDNFKENEWVNPDNWIEFYIPRVVEEFHSLQEEIKKISKDENLSIERKKEKIEESNRKLNKCREQINNERKNLFDESKAIATTLTKFGMDASLQDRHFDTIIIDEASMASLPLCYLATLLTRKNIIFVGDFRQLAPIAISKGENVARWLKKDVFEKGSVISRFENGINDDRLIMLKEQYRMHPKISDIPNELWYNKQLIDHKTTYNKLPQHKNIEFSDHLTIVDISSLKTKASRYSAKKEDTTRRNLVSALITSFIANSIGEASYGSSTGIITPFRGQAELISHLTHSINKNKPVEAATVHRYQGDERDIIVMDMTVAAGIKEGFSKLLDDDENENALRLLNVAITRAKSQFILIADLKFIKNQNKGSDDVRKFIDKLEASAKIINFSTQNFGEKIPDHVHLLKKGTPESILPKESVQKEIIMGGKFTSFQINQIEATKANTKVPLVTTKRIQDNSSLIPEKVFNLKPSLDFGFALLDSRYVFLSLINGKTSVIIDNKNLAAYLKKHLNVEESMRPSNIMKLKERCPECNNELSIDIENNKIKKICKKDSKHKFDITSVELNRLAIKYNIKCQYCPFGKEPLVANSNRLYGAKLFLKCKDNDCKFTMSQQEVIKQINETA